tara:strand:+ start:33 stop:950 length:918 start_codon:yes stop_codon:yes gene_type:complete
MALTKVTDSIIDFNNIEIEATGTNAAPHIKLTESGDTREFNIFNDGSGNGHLVLADSDDDTPDTEIVLNDNGIITMLTGNAERMRLGSDGDLFLNTTSAMDNCFASFQDGNNGEAMVGISAKNDNNVGIRFGVGTTRKWVNYRDTSDNLIWYSNAAGAERVRFYSGGGITFNGNNAAANALDDYEEGTFTPVIDSGTATCTGFYTKIGNLVNIRFFIGFSAAGTSSNPIRISSLPFPSTASTDGSVGSAMARFLTTDNLVSYVPTNSSTLEFYNTQAGNWDIIVHSDIANNSCQIHGTHTYTTAS